MKYLMLLLLVSGCSLIKVNEAPEQPKHRPEFIGITETINTGEELQTRIRVSEIAQYFTYGSVCRIVLRGEREWIDTKSSCNEIDAVVRQ